MVALVTASPILGLSLLLLYLADGTCLLLACCGEQQRRAWLVSELNAWGGKQSVKPRVLFLESICTDDAMIRSNVRETKLKSPDYMYTPPRAALRLVAFTADCCRIH